MVEKILTITLVIKELYHTTILYNNNSKQYYEEQCEDNNDYIVPQPNTVPNDLSHHKWFTIHPKASYADNWTGYNYVFLKYRVLNPLTLVDLRTNSVNNFKDIIKKITTVEADGYIGYGDVIELYLTTPSKYIDSNYEIMTMPKIKYTFDELGIINKESEEIINNSIIIV